MGRGRKDRGGSDGPAGHEATGRGQNGARDGEDDSFASLAGDVSRFEPVKRPGDSPRRRPRNAAEKQPEQRERLFHYPEPLEPRLGRATDCPERTLDRLLNGEPAPQERIDLHGLTQERAQERLARALESAAARKLKCVLVIHGRGRGSGEAGAVLREAVPEWLTSAPCARSVRAFAPARRRDGGEGALYVLLVEGAERDGSSTHRDASD